jgi:hypothetical protein
LGLFGLHGGAHPGGPYLAGRTFAQRVERVLGRGPLATVQSTVRGRLRMHCKSIAKLSGPREPPRKADLGARIRDDEVRDGLQTTKRSRHRNQGHQFNHYPRSQKQEAQNPGIRACNMALWMNRDGSYMGDLPGRWGLLHGDGRIRTVTSPLDIQT